MGEVGSAVLHPPARWAGGYAPGISSAKCAPRLKPSPCYNRAMPKTLAYTLTIEFHEDERGYLAFFPALPGCHTWGDTYEEAVKNAREVLIGYLEAVQKVSSRKSSLTQD